LERRRHSDGERGAVAVEFALVFPVLILIILGILEFGFGYHAWDVTQNAAREGARVGAVDARVDDIEARVRGTSNVLDQSLLHVTVQCQPAAGGAFSSNPCADAGDVVRVTVVYRYDYITPLPNFVSMGDSMTLTSVSEARFEGF
jgi:Flp pilus assembly protein TadG